LGVECDGVVVEWLLMLMLIALCSA